MDTRGRAAWNGVHNAASVYPKGETERLSGCLTRLRPHLRLDEIALAGGVAISLRVAETGMAAWRHSIPDLDFVARRREAIASSVAEEFLVCHYHLPQPGYPKFLVMVADSVSRIRVDVFPDLVGFIGKAQPMSVCGLPWLVLDFESMLDHKLLTLAEASERRPVDEKHHRDAVLLAKLLGRSVPDVPPTSFRTDVYSTDLDAQCARCEASRDPAFPLAPKRRVFELLGYV